MIIEIGKREIILSVDVARSGKTANNKTVISVIEEKRASDGFIKTLDLVNMYVVSNLLTFSAQAAFIKSMQKQYSAKIVIVDVNGLGTGLRDELLKPTIDMSSGEEFPPWDSINGDIRSEYDNASSLLYSLASQSKDETKKDGKINNYAIVNFIDCVESKRLRLLEERKDENVNLNSIDDVEGFIPFKQTNALIDEISNLKLEHLTNGEVNVKQVLKRIDKDRFSSLMYGLWWAMTYDNSVKKDNKDLVRMVAQLNRISVGNHKSSLSNIFR